KAQPCGAEPVHFLPFVEDDLQTTSPDREEPEAEIIEFAYLGVAHVGRIFNKAADHERGENADRNIDVKSIAPTEGVRKPATQRGAEHGCYHHSEGEDGHGHSALAWLKAFKQDGLRQWLQRAATGALYNAGQQNHCQ